MKELFEVPEMEVIPFAVKDIIATSNGGQLDDDEVPPIIVG